jgi:tetratricopeptide (TPR) repeat protein
MDDYPYDLGRHSWPVTTRVPAAQTWFDRGLIWTYGFNHEEAVRCFQRAVQADPDCAMAHWGVAYASGPNYNMPWDLFDDQGRSHALKAGFQALAAARACPVPTAPEAALIDALAHRFPQETPITDMAPWDDAYARAMRDVQNRYPESRDVRALTVEAMMQRTPWKMWDIATGTIPEGADTAACIALLQDAFATDPAALAHPGLTHLHVHLMEMSPTPEVALRSADTLRTLVPDAGHLVHMPTHIDVQVGAYQDVVFWNERAVAADLKYYAAEGAANIYTGYRQHNYHFVIYGAMFAGQLAPARRALRGLRDTTPEDFLRIESPPMADYFEAYLAFEPHVLVRFGLWDEACARALPADPALYCTDAAFTLYGRAVGHAALGRVAEAEAAEAAFLAACDAVPETRLLHNCRVVDLLEIAKAMARGEILYRKGDHDAAFAALRRAVALEDALPYDEPWGWMQPSRHALGALLFEQGRLAEAESVFREDLGLGGTLPRAQIHPANVWALRGLHDCLEARGETAERAHVRAQLDVALARADARVAAACFCAVAAMQTPCCP